MPCFPVCVCVCVIFYIDTILGHDHLYQVKYFTDCVYSDMKAIILPDELPEGKNEKERGLNCILTFL